MLGCEAKLMSSLVCDDLRSVANDHFVPLMPTSTIISIGRVMLCSLLVWQLYQSLLWCCIGEQVVPQRTQDVLAEPAAADWVAPPLLPQAAGSHIHEPQQHAPRRHFRVLPPVQPVLHRLPAQAALDPHLAPPSPSPMEQGRVLPEFPELARRPAASAAGPVQAEHIKQAVPSKSRPGAHWPSLMSEPQGAALLRKDLQPLSSLESVGTPLGRRSPAPEQAAPASLGEHAESAHDQEQHHKQQYASVEPDLPPKKRKSAREMTPPLSSGHHLWAPQTSTKPAAAPSAGHHDDHWDAVVPKRQRQAQSWCRATAAAAAAPLPSSTGLSSQLTQPASNVFTQRRTLRPRRIRATRSACCWKLPRS